MKQYLFVLTLGALTVIQTMECAAKRARNVSKRSRTTVLTAQQQILSDLENSKAHVVLDALKQLNNIEFSIEDQINIQKILSDLARTAKNPAVKIAAAQTAEQLFT